MRDSLTGVIASDKSVFTDIAPDARCVDLFHQPGDRRYEPRSRPPERAGKVAKTRVGLRHRTHLSARTTPFGWSNFSDFGQRTANSGVPISVSHLITHGGSS